MRCRRVILFVAIIMASGCSYNVQLDPNIDPTANISNPIDANVGLFVPEEVRSYSIADNSNWANKYTFEAGEAIESIVTKSVQRVFSSVEVIESFPTEQMIKERSLELVVIPKVTSARVALNQKEGFWQNSASGSTQFSVQLTFYDAAMLQFAAIQGSGMGVANEGIGAFSTGKDEYAASVESALRNLGDDLVHQTYGNYDLRTRAESGAFDDDTGP